MLTLDVFTQKSSEMKVILFIGKLSHQIGSIATKRSCKGTKITHHFVKKWHYWCHCISMHVRRKKIANQIMIRFSFCFPTWNCCNSQSTAQSTLIYFRTGISRARVSQKRAFEIDGAAMAVPIKILDRTFSVNARA